MLTIEKTLSLSRVDLFAGLAGESLAEIAAAAEEMELAAGQGIEVNGERCYAMYVVASGKVRLGGAEQAPACEAGGAFGELNALDPGGEGFTVTALEDSLLLRIEHETLFDLIAEDADLAKTIIRSLCRRLGTASQAGS